MPILSSAVSLLSWVVMVVLLVPLALMLLAAIPTGALASIAVHTALLVVGAAVLLALKPDDD